MESATRLAQCRGVSGGAPRGVNVRGQGMHPHLRQLSPPRLPLTEGPPIAEEKSTGDRACVTNRGRANPGGSPGPQPFCNQISPRRRAGAIERSWHARFGRERIRGPRSERRGPGTRPAVRDPGAAPRVTGRFGSWIPQLRGVATRRVTARPWASSMRRRAARARVPCPRDRRVAVGDRCHAGEPARHHLASANWRPPPPRSQPTSKLRKGVEDPDDSPPPLRPPGEPIRRAGAEKARLPHHPSSPELRARVSLRMPAPPADRGHPFPWRDA